MKTKKLFSLGCLVFTVFFFVACGNTGSNPNTPNTDYGTLSLGLTDAATDNYKAVYVTINEVKINRKENAVDGSEGWITVAAPRKTFNLVNLVNGVIEPLGITDLEAGHYSQLRLYLGQTPDAEKNILGEDHIYPNYVILDDTNNTVEKLTIPSGYQTGVKLVRDFDIIAGLTVDLVVDFDAAASVIESGHSGKYQLKPTIKITDTLNNAILSGTVTDDSEEPAYLDGVLVSAQYYEDSIDPIIFTATRTEAGKYMMYLPPNNYNIVAYKSGYSPECKNITAALDDMLDKNFTLTAVTPITVSVNIRYPITPNSDVSPSASISFRKLQECTPAVGTQVIEVDKLNVAGEGDFPIDLPKGEYSYVASSEGMDPVSGMLNTDSPTLDIEFVASAPPQ